MMEEPNPLVIGQAFVRQYYTFLNKAPDYLHGFYKGSSSYVHGGIDPNGKLTEAVYGQEEIHKKILSLQFSKCHTKIRHLEAHTIISDGVIVQVFGELSNSGQPMRKFMQTFVLAPNDSVGNKFYVHNDILRYTDEVFPDADEDFLEPEAISEELKPQEEIEEKAQEPVPEESPPNTQEAPKTFSWAVVSSNNLPPIGSVTSQIMTPPPVEEVKQPRVESKRPPQPQREQRNGNRRSFPPQDPRPAQGDLSSVNKGVREAEPEDMEKNHIVQYPNEHQLFVRNLPHDVERSELKKFFTKYGNVVDLQIKTRRFGGKLTTFGFVVFEDSDPVKRILEAELQGPIIFRGHVHLSVEEKKMRAVHEHEHHEMRRKDWELRGSRGIGGSGMRNERDGVREAEPEDMEKNHIVQYPNEHQLFVRNLPHDVERSELKKFFTKYGNVVDLQIKTRGFGGKVTTFGFVVFEDSDPVKRILEAELQGPIIFRGHVHLSVEEKKTRAVREHEHHEMWSKDWELRGSRGIGGSGMRSERDGVTEGERGDMENRQRVVRYPNKHQLFVGNIPQDIDVNELKEFFMRYGNVLELRINTRGVGEKLPNFGFLIFDDSDPVQRILEEKPIIFRDDVHLNVEERKTRSVRERERYDMQLHHWRPRVFRGSEGGGGMRYSRGPRPMSWRGP